MAALILRASLTLVAHRDRVLSSLAVLPPTRPPSRLSQRLRPVYPLWHESCSGKRVWCAARVRVIGRTLSYNHSHTVRVQEYNMTSHQGATAMAEHKTDVRDEVYDVVSVLYHALSPGCPRDRRSEARAIFPGSTGVPSTPGHSGQGGICIHANCIVALR